MNISFKYGHSWSFLCTNLIACCWASLMIWSSTGTNSCGNLWSKTYHKYLHISLTAAVEIYSLLGVLDYFTLIFLRDHGFVVLRNFLTLSPCDKYFKGSLPNLISHLSRKILDGEKYEF